MTQALRYANVVDVKEQDRAVAALLAVTPVLVGVATRAVEGLEDGVSLAQFRLLLVLADHGPAPSSVVARRLGTAPSTVTRAADQLEPAGHLTRRREEANRTVVTLELTATGRELVARVLDRRHAELAALVSRLPRDVTARLADDLDALHAAAGDTGTAP